MPSMLRTCTCGDDLVQWVVSIVLEKYNMNYFRLPGVRKHFVLAIEDQLTPANTSYYIDIFELFKIKIGLLLVKVQSLQKPERPGMLCVHWEMTGRWLNTGRPDPKPEAHKAQRQTSAWKTGGRKLKDINQSQHQHVLYFST